MTGSMTPISSASASGILTAVGDVGNYVIQSLINLSPVFLSVAGIGLVIGMIYGVVRHLRAR